ncbi:MAG: ATP-grasp domain-containing protein [Acidobacteriota bacterium]
MTFYCIARKENQKVLTLLQKACDVKGINMRLYDQRTFTTLSGHDFPRAGDLLYRASADIWPNVGTRIIEQHLSQEGVATFYSSWQGVFHHGLDYFLLYEKMGIPTPRTIPHLTAHRATLKEYVKLLGGFPIILKVLGRSKGKGVLKIDSYPALFSTLDYILTLGVPVIMREYVPTPEAVRVIVVGNQTVAAVQFTPGSDDFRSNIGSGRTVKSCSVTPLVTQLALQASRVRGVEFAGVDILFRPDGAPVVAETNFPCQFATTQQISGVDIAARMIEYLQQKTTESLPMYEKRSHNIRV